jgi:hypothetical protein
MTDDRGTVDHRDHGVREWRRMNVVEHELRAYLQTEDGAHDPSAASLAALPLYRGWTGTVYLTDVGPVPVS